MADPKLIPLKVFISFASEDDALREEMVKHFAQLERDGLIESWHGRQIGAGEDWAGQIDAQLEAADIVLLLVSPAFLHSRYCYDVEMKRALERHAAGHTQVIPVILRPADWQTAPFAKLQAFPRNAKPVVSWASRDDAFLDVASGLRRRVGEIRASRSRDAGPAPAVRASSTPASGPGPAQEGAPKVSPRRRQAVMLMVVPTLLLGIAGVVLTSWRVPTRAAFDLVVNRVAFTVGGSKSIAFPQGPLDFRTFTVERFDRATVGSTTIEAGEDEPSELTVAAAAKGTTPVGRMESIVVERGRKVVLETMQAEGPTLTMRVVGQSLLSRVLPAAQIEVRVKGANKTGGPGTRASAQPLVLVPPLIKNSPASFVTVEGNRPSFAITVTTQPGAEALLMQGLPVSDVEFLQEGDGDSVKSSLLEAGHGTYADGTSPAPIVVNPGDFLGVGELRDASLTRLALLGKGAMQLRLEGVFGKLDTLASGVKRDRRLNAFDRIWYGSRPVLFLALFAWLVFVLAGTAMLVRERSGYR